MHESFPGRNAKRVFFKVLIFTLNVCLLLVVPTVRTGDAQVLYGSIVGNVTDSSGAGVPGASVTAIQLETNESRETKTNDAGEYSLTTLHTGTYKVSVMKPGFQNFTTENVALSLNNVVRVNSMLQVGQQTQTVQVTAESALLQTEKADVHAEFNAKALSDLPEPTRSFEGIVALMPGVSAPPAASSGGTNNPGKTFAISADGESRSGVNVLIDGISATNPWVQFYATYSPSVEAIQTVNVTTAGSGAEQALTNGASIGVQTKSGTNDLHGSLYEYNITNKFEARPFFLPSNQGLPKLIENDLGATIGGRIIKNKLFYFGSYEGDFIAQGSANSTITIPTSAIASGNLAGSPTAIYDPATGTYNAQGTPTGRTPFAGNIIPANRISAISQKLVALVPQPNQPSASATAPANNYYANTPINNKLQHIDTKYDWVASDKWKINGRYGFQPYNITQPPIFGNILNGGPNTSAFGHSIAAAGSVTYIASPTLVFDGTVGFTKALQNLNPADVDQKLGSAYLGIPGTNLGSLPQAGGMPQFAIANYTTYCYAYPPLQYNDPVFQYVANGTKIAGPHSIRFGINIERQHMNHIETAPTSFSFNGGATQCGPNCTSNPSANAYNSFADFLLGLPQSYANSYEPAPLTLRAWEDSLYIQDTWQVNKRLTLSAGLRWEYYPVPTRGSGDIESFNFQTNQVLVCADPPNNSTCGITVQKDLFAPRIGIAYRPSESLVIRAGYSLSPEQINMFRDGISTYPERLDYTANGLSSYDPVGTLATGIPLLPAPVVTNGSISLPAGSAPQAIIPQNSRFIRGYTESENFTIQKDFGHGWIASAGYVGTLTIHQHTRYNINYGTLNGGTTSQPFYKTNGVSGSVVEILPYETQHYNSLQTSLNHRFSSGFLFSANYTRSKMIGTCCDESGDGGPQITLPQYANLNRALESYDRPNAFNASGVYELPFGKGKPFLTTGIAGSIIGGWHLQGVFVHYSGAPFSASGGSALNTPGFTQRAQQLLPNVQYPGNEGPGQLYFNTAAFAPVTAPGVIGNAGYNTLRGPGLTNLDTSLFREFRVKERLIFQFRAEALNTSNTPHFSTPQGSVTSPTFGQITSTTTVSRLIDPRYLRLGLKISF
jgi:outer membrane receptor protein involved in Fe transport